MLFFVTIGAGALLFWLGALYVASTKAVPDYGGEYTEGLVSQPRYINPILSQTSEADADLAELIYSGLFTYDAEGKLQKSLAICGREGLHFVPLAWESLDMLV